MKRRANLLVVGFLFLFGCGRDLEIAEVTIRSIGSRVVGPGIYSSLAIDDLGAPHVVIYDEDRRGLYYYTPVNGQWVGEPIDETPDAGRFNAIAVGLDRRIWIAYYVFRNNEGFINIAYKNIGENTWHYMRGPDSTSTNEGGWLSMALDLNRRPHIAYVDMEGQNLLYAYYDGSQWQGFAIDQGYAPGCYHVCRITSTTSIKINSNNEPVITYYDGGNGNLKFAKIYNVFEPNRRYAEIEIVQTEIRTGELLHLQGPSTIQIPDPQDPGSTILKWVYRARLQYQSDGQKANTRIYDQAGTPIPPEEFGFVEQTQFQEVWIDMNSVDPHSSYYIDYTRADPTISTDEGWSNDIYVRPGNVDEYHVCYYNLDNHSLYYAFKNDRDNVWQWEEVDSGLNYVGAYCRVGYDEKEDAPFIVYFDATLNNLKIAYKYKEGWRRFIADATGTLGEFISLAFSPVSEEWGVTYYSRLRRVIIYGSYFPLE
jgi:hypothetical protein